MVAPAVTAPLVIGLDVGGTKILSGLVDREGNVIAEREAQSPGESESDVLDALDAAVKDSATGYRRTSSGAAEGS